MSPSTKAWLCPKCRAALEEGALRCKDCGAPFQGPRAEKPDRLDLSVRDYRLPNGGAGAAFGVDLIDGEDD